MQHHNAAGGTTRRLQLDGRLPLNESPAPHASTTCGTSVCAACCQETSEVQKILPMQQHEPLKQHGGKNHAKTPSPAARDGGDGEGGNRSHAGAASILCRRSLCLRPEDRVTSAAYLELAHGGGGESGVAAALAQHRTHQFWLRALVHQQHLQPPRDKVQHLEM